MATPPAVPQAESRKPRAFPLVRTEQPVTNGKETELRIDVERLRREFLDAPEREWTAFLGRANYPLRTPAEVPWRTWQREKKYIQAWQAVRQEVEDLGTATGPRNLVTAMRAAKTIPEVAEGLVAVIRHMTVESLQGIAADQKASKEWANGELPESARRFKLAPHEVATLAGALEMSRKTLFECLGLESALGLEPERWAALADQHLSKFERETEPLPEPQKRRRKSKKSEGSEKSSEAPIGVQIEVLGAREGLDSRELIRQAFEKYFDRPPVAPVAAE